jgi:hypothetical protein
MIKCYICRSNPKHTFNDCMSSSCSCLCVQELYLFPKNELIEDIPDASPKFLKIHNVEIKKLPDLAKAVTQFNKIDRGEWLPKKKDKRFTNKRKRLESKI